MNDDDERDDFNPHADIPPSVLALGEQADFEERIKCERGR